MTFKFNYHLVKLHKLIIIMLILNFFASFLIKFDFDKQQNLQTHRILLNHIK
jgi:hypothetical protein